MGVDYNYFLDYLELSEEVLELLKNEDPALEGALRYILLDDSRILRIKKKDGKCIFFKDGKCSIYSVRPKICRIYPYWCVELIDGTVKVIQHDYPNLCSICDVDNVDEKEIKKLFDEIFGMIIKEKPDIVAFSIVYSSQAFYAKAMLEALKKKYYDCDWWTCSK